MCCTLTCTPGHHDVTGLNEVDNEVVGLRYLNNGVPDKTAMSVELGHDHSFLLFDILGLTFFTMQLLVKEVERFVVASQRSTAIVYGGEGQEVGGQGGGGRG